MLAPSPATRDHCHEPSTEEDEFLDFADDGDLLDIIDFDDLFGVAGDVLPDLELLSGDFSDESDHMNASSTTSSEKTDKGILGISEEVVISKRDDDEIGVAETVTVTYDGESDLKRKYSFTGVSKNNRISTNKEVLKRKVKVDWTAELHRRFVEAVELLGLDKAVPSRILELMGVHSLTRHNVASHLQKYRSHRKHLLAREAEAANWTRKRHMYGVDNVIGRNKNGWLAPAAPTLGFPPPHVHHQHNFRPLHVWGHPTVDHLAMSHHVWPKHLPPPSTAMPYQPFWIFDSLCLHPTNNGTTQYLPTIATRFKAQSVAGIPKTLPPYDMVYKPDHQGSGGSRPPLDLHPTKERVDAAIGDVLTRPWLPLPLGLKPPAIDSVMKELHCHGVSEVPMTASCA